ncbi:hypothetical protein [Hyphomonas sp.]|uniref:hypothetical protein n=1 Tax=Hyphomonas sp. TaxID=87 RepID=UPI0025C71746|nr:hypothetical protein [Hyphomonas sp.]MBI1400954.1 hypothetical protein [Hyphomonas sp.]
MTPRYFEISIVRWCGEFVCGRVTQAFFDYWKGRPEEDLATFMTAWETDEREAGVPAARSDGSTPDNWYEFDDVEHISNAVTNNNYIRVVELEPGEPEGSFRIKAGGYEEDFEISAIAGQMPKNFLTCVRSIEVDQDTDGPADPVIVGKALAKGADTVARCTTSGPFDIRKLSISYIDFDGDHVVDGLTYDGQDLEVEGQFSDGKAMLFYLGDLNVLSPYGGDAAPAAGGVKPPGKLRLLAGTLWPSFATTLKAVFSLFGFPVFLLAMIGAAKYLHLFDLIELKGLALRIIETQKDALDEIAELAAKYGIGLPSAVADAFVLYLSVGNTMARAEKGDLVNVDNDDSDHWSLFKEWLTRGRVDSLLLSLPKITRDGFVRLFWPVMMLYRLKTPFVVTGAGPGGDIISSSVPRRELSGFAEMVTEARGTWKGQTVQDFRQIFLWHVVLVLGASALTAHVLQRLG